MPAHLTFTNKTDRDIVVVWEPLGENFRLRPGSRWRGEGTFSEECLISARDGIISIETPDTIEGFFDTVKVFVDGELAWG